VGLLKAIAVGGGEDFEEEGVIPDGALDLAARRAKIGVRSQEVEGEAQAGEVVWGVVLTPGARHVQRPAPALPVEAAPRRLAVERHHLVARRGEGRNGAAEAGLERSSSGNTREKASWLGTPSRRRKRRKNGLARPNRAMSTQLSAPNTVAARTISRISHRSCRCALAVHGSSKSPKHARNRSTPPSSRKTKAAAHQAHAKPKGFHKFLMQFPWAIRATP
jgi:hypothetical protein